MKGALTGNASQALWDTDRNSTNSLKKLVSVLKSRYSGERQAEKHRAELQIRRRKPHESLSDLHQDIRRLTVLAYPKLTAEAREEIACDRFTEALSDPDLALKVKERTPKSLDEALCVTLRLEAWAKSVRSDRPDDDRFDRSERPRQKARTAVAKPEISKKVDSPETSDRLVKIESEMSKIQDTLKKLTTKPPTSSGSANTQWQRPEPRVSDSAREGHPPLDPRAVEFQPKTQQPTPYSPQTQNGKLGGYNRPTPFPYQSPSVVCWDCNLPGHIRRNCPKKSQQTFDTATSAEAVSRSSRMKKKEKLPASEKSDVYITMTLFGKEVSCLLDSGCEATLVPRSILSHLKRIDMEPVDRKVYAANDTPIHIEGKVCLPFVFDEQCIWTEALVSEDIEETMLGIDWLKQNECVWDFSTGKLSINGQPAVTLARHRPTKYRRVLAQEYQEIPPRSQKTVIARVTLLKAHEPSHTDIIVETNRLKPGLYVGRTLLPPQHRDVKVSVANTTTKPQLITPGSYLGRAVEAKVAAGEDRALAFNPRDSVPVANGESSFADIVEPTLEKLPADITEEQRRQIVQFLQEYDDMFSRGTFDMGRTTLVEHSIDTGQNRPIRQALRRHPYAHLDEIDRQVDELQQNEFIEPAASPWASNVVLVKKKDGSYRLCVDYRQLNSVTYKDSYPLPHIDTCLGSMKGAVWFSTLDLRSGYHNIPIKESDKDKTAFITRRGCFRYKVMPFGLTCAPSVFQRLMDLVLCGLTYLTCLVYLDDIIVFSSDFDSHIERLREIFDRLRMANLKIHMKKCSLFQKRVDFLGHVITEDGIEVQSDKVKSVQNWPTPRNLTELRSFVGLCSYYRRFIPNFAGIAASLHDLTRKNARFSWGLEQEEAFNQLKECLTTAPVLGMPQDEGTFYLDTDASDVGVGAVLSQEQDGQEIVLAYASRVMTRTERNYDVTRRELLAVVYGLKTYKQYLLGRQFVIRTDHSALQSLRKTAEPIGQQARWQTFIEQFSFSILHRPGSRHRNADALSRRPVVENSDSEEESRQCRTTKIRQEKDTSPDHVQASARECESMAELQKQDSDIGPIYRLRSQKSEQPQPETVISESESVKVLWGQWHSLVIKEDILYRTLPQKHGKQTVMQLIVPAVKRTEFIKQCHQGMTGGHRAFRSTLEQVRRRGFWYGWRRDVKRFCRQCQPCSSYHRGRLPRTGLLQPLITGTVFERCHVDITGPHPRTSRGSKYILSFVDAFSKWAEAFAIPNKEAKTVARVLVEQVFCRLGTPVALLTDNAGELDGHLMQEICRLMDIDKQHTSFYHPETNSVAERFHGTLNAMMGRVVSENQSNWDLCLPFVMAAYRATVHQSTGFSPNYLMMAREVRAPADLVFGIPVEQPPVSYDRYSAEMEDRLKQAYTMVREHLGVAAERMKRQYDIRVRPQTFHKGQWVLYYNPRKFQGRQQKWERKFSPYLVIKELPPVNYLIQKSKRSRPIIAHVDKLKRWETDSPPKSWVVDDVVNADDASNTSSPVTQKNEEQSDGNDESPRQHSGQTPQPVSWSDEAVHEVCNEESAQVQNDAAQDDDHHSDTDDNESKDDHAIAGDPCSTTHRPSRPRRKIRCPARYRDSL